MSNKKSKELARYLVREKLMNNGKPHEYLYIDIYIDIKTGEQKRYKFHLIEIEPEGYDIKSKTVTLRLSEHGLDLLFKTKEIYNELQISIAQLYLRQQIQKGVFDGALRSIDELDLAVRKRKQRIQQLERKIIKDVLYVAREDELKKQIDSINEQLESEKSI